MPTNRARYHARLRRELAGGYEIDEHDDCFVVTTDSFSGTHPRTGEGVEPTGTYVHREDEIEIQVAPADVVETIKQMAVHGRRWDY